LIAVNLDRVSITYLMEPVFEDLSWEIHDDRVVGLVGANGSGKSTLLRLISNEAKSEAGFTVRKKDLSIGYLHQEPQLTAGNTVFNEVFSASFEIQAIEDDLNAIEKHLSDPAVYENENKLERTLERQAKLLQAYTDLGGPSLEGRVRTTLFNLGFQEADLELPVDVLSGGQKKLIGLARLLVQKPDLLLLDEPDNHLDLQGKAFLERYIRGYKGAVILVSHDRYLLDLVVDEIVEIENGNLTHYVGGYSEYAFEKQARLMRQQQLFQAQQKEIHRLEQAAQRMLTWGAVFDNEKFSKRGKNILKRLERLDRVDQPANERRRMGLELSGWRGSNKVLEILDLEKSFPAPGDEDHEHNVLRGLNLLLRRGERVGLVGPNGSGKSVLLRLILEQETPSNGEIRIGPSVKIGFYAQEHQTLDYERSLLESVRQAANLSETGAVSFLGRFIFPYDQVHEKVSTLSGGERSRLQMALLMLSGANFLLLDEPTNNLDIPSAEVLENALEDFEGSVLVISHDRYFLDRVVDRTVALDDGALTEYLGGYSEYRAAINKA
jgi:ATP-binding cassette, subfamily F, member 3